MGRKKIELDLEKIVKEYLNGEELIPLANKYSVSQWTLLARFKELGIRKTIKRYYNKQAFYFFTPESCYWAGFLAADGWVHKDNYSLGCELSIKDSDHLEKLKVFLNSNADIKTRTRKMFNKNIKSAYVSIYSVDLVRDLKHNFNIKPKKSLTYNPPQLPEDLIRHFIRGYFDGDGCIRWHKCNKTPKLNICSGSKPLLEWVKNKIENILNVDSPNIVLRETENDLGEIKKLFIIEYGVEATLKITDWFYNDTNPDIRLKRKYDLTCSYTNKYLSKKEEKQEERNDLINQMVELYNSGCSYSDVANEMDLGPEKVRYYLKQENIEKKKTNNQNLAGIKRKQRDLEMLKLYRENTAPKNIAKNFDIALSTFWVAIRRAKQYEATL